MDAQSNWKTVTLPHTYNEATWCDMYQCLGTLWLFAYNELTADMQHGDVAHWVLHDRWTELLPSPSSILHLYWSVKSALLQFAGHDLKLTYKKRPESRF